MPNSYRLESLVNFYEKNAREHKNTFKIVAWGSRKSQEKRFEILSQIAELEGRSLLDVGCGTGDFYGWLKARYEKFHYTGFDLAPSLIARAKRNYPRVRFEIRNILDYEKTKPSFDYVLSSGIFNRKIPNHKQFVRDTIRKMFALCKKGMALNIMSKNADFKLSDEFYIDPKEMFDFCFKLSGKAVLRHDYMPHDLTIYIYK